MSPRPESIKKVMEVLGDFNPSEDKIKKTLGIDEQEMRLINEEKQTITSPAKDRIPINRKLTKKAQDTLGINLSKEKLMDVLGVDEITINCAESEENEFKENKIKLKRENSITTNKRSLQKALSKLGIDASTGKLSRTLGIPKDELSNDNNSNINNNNNNNSGTISSNITLTSYLSSPIHLLFFIALGILLITLFLILQQKDNFIIFKNNFQQSSNTQQQTMTPPQFINNNHNHNNHHHHHFSN